MLAVEATSESVQYILEVLCGDPYIRQLYSTTGNCRFHCRGYAPNNETLGSHVRYLYNHTEGIRRMECHAIVELILLSLERYYCIGHRRERTLLCLFIIP